jgi:holin-like protein
VYETEPEGDIRVRHGKKYIVAFQLLLLIAFWLLGEGLVRASHIPIPGAIVGMFLLLSLLMTNKLKVTSVVLGAEWLLTEMLLFFIPAVLVVLKHPEFFGLIGAKLLLTILFGTVIVMASTAFTVDIWWRFTHRSEAQ